MSTANEEAAGPQALDKLINKLLAYKKGSNGIKIAGASLNFCYY